VKNEQKKECDFDVATLSISADSGRKVVHKRRVHPGSP
jgi:hypothetical protein